MNSEDHYASVLKLIYLKCNIDCFIASHCLSKSWTRKNCRQNTSKTMLQQSRSRIFLTLLLYFSLDKKISERWTKTLWLCVGKCFSQQVAVLKCMSNVLPYDLRRNIYMSFIALDNRPQTLSSVMSTRLRNCKKWMKGLFV